MSITHLLYPKYRQGDLMAHTEEQVLETLPGVRPVLDQIAHKWSILILTFLCEEPKRFNALKRRLDGISKRH